MGKSWSDRGKQFKTVLASYDTIIEDLMKCLKQAKWS